MIRLSFICERNLASQAIAWFSAGRFSHVDAIVPEGLLGARSDVARAFTGKRGVQIRPEGYAKFSRRAVYSLPSTPRQQTRFYTFLYDQLGKPYDRKAIWGFFLDRDWREAGSWFCSELQCRALEAAGIIYPIVASRVTPCALLSIITAIGATLYYEETPRALLSIGAPLYCEGTP